MKKQILQQHEEWLKKMGVKGRSVKRNSYSGSDSLIVGQAYNKGNYVVLSKEEAADPSTGKRRC